MVGLIIESYLCQGGCIFSFVWRIVCLVSVQKNYSANFHESIWSIGPRKNSELLSFPSFLGVFSLSRNWDPWETTCTSVALTSEAYCAPDFPTHVLCPTEADIRVAREIVLLSLVSHLTCTHAGYLSNGCHVCSKRLPAPLSNRSLVFFIWSRRR